MLWPVDGADNVLSIRCAVMNKDFDSFWDNHRPIAQELKQAA